MTEDPTEEASRRPDLDDLEAIAGLDSEDVLGAVERFAGQCREAWLLGRSATDLPQAEGIDGVLVLGMGGSGISGDVLQAVVQARLPLPLIVIKGYGQPLPEWVGRNTLVFAVSYSGSTEETVVALEEAIARGARTIAVSSGGPLAEIAAQHGMAHVRIPPGLQPRASLGYLTMPLFAALTTMGLIPDMQEDVDEAVEILSDIAERSHRKRGTSENPAKGLASKIVGRIPVVYGGEGIGAVAAYRFKCDLNEYGKTPAFWHFLPELDHNEIVGWNRLADVTSRSFMMILLRDPDEHERVSLRFDITQRLVRDNVAEIVELQAEGTSLLARILSLVLVTQIAAIYVGLAYGVDPGPVESIQKLKAELAQN
ncbi:MAG: bifunctional phosphoglucose/phosphomannose isomerase [Actinobacteria bacterium]|nr:bifunctional phosphoglucose/phosphomannose isomerase [Actinomycetota bacterium]